MAGSSSSWRNSPTAWRFPLAARAAAIGQVGSLPAVYGQRSGHNIYLLDGVKVTDEFYNNLVVSPSIDAIQEFKIQKTMYPAEFGGKASTLINVVTDRIPRRTPRTVQLSAKRPAAADGRSNSGRPTRTTSQEKWVLNYKTAVDHLTVAEIH